MLMFAAAATGTVFTSCSKDDDPQPSQDEKKEPKYEVKDMIWSIAQVKQGGGSYTEFASSIYFNPDGTFVSTLDHLAFQGGAKYEYDDENTITFKGKREGQDTEETVKVTIVSLKEGAFEIKLERADPMGGTITIEYKGTATKGDG